MTKFTENTKKGNVNLILGGTPPNDLWVDLDATQVQDNYKKLKAEVSKKASMANKRLVRLENNGLQELPAYQRWVDYKGGVKFSVKGKDYNQLQQELARLNQFIDSKTSTVRGANKILKEIAENTGVKYKSVKELQAKTKEFFTIANKVDQYLMSANRSAIAIGYNKIWETINEYVQGEKLDLGSGTIDIDQAVKEISEMLDYENIEVDFGFFNKWQFKDVNGDLEPEPKG